MTVFSSENNKAVEIVIGKASALLVCVWLALTSGLEQELTERTMWTFTSSERTETELEENFFWLKMHSIVMPTALSGQPIHLTMFFFNQHH